MGLRGLSSLLEAPHSARVCAVHHLGPWARSAAELGWALCWGTLEAEGRVGGVWAEGWRAGLTFTRSMHASILSCSTALRACEMLVVLLLDMPSSGPRP